MHSSLISLIGLFLHLFYSFPSSPSTQFIILSFPYSMSMLFFFLFFFYSVSAAPYRSRSVVNLHHQDTETDEATMVLPPEDYSDTPQHNISSTSNVITNNNHQHSLTPSAASSTSDHNTVSHWASNLVYMLS